MSLLEVDALKWANEAIEKYREGYKQRYGTEPVLDPVLPATMLFKKLARNFGRERLLELVAFYLESNGDNDWYVRKGHSIETMSRGIEAINAALAMSKQRRQTTPSGFDPAVTFWTSCKYADRGCREQFEVTCKASQMEKYAYSVPCPKCKQSPDRVFTLQPGLRGGPVVKKI